MSAYVPDPSRRNEHSRRAILDAALSLVGELGYDKVSIEAIARRAGCGKQTIYRWWSSKGAVVLEAATQSLNPVVVFPDTGDLVADLRAQLVDILELVTTTSFGAAYRGVIAAGQSEPDLLEAAYQQVVEPNIKGFSARAALAQQRGEIRADADVATLRDVLYGVIEYRIFHAMPLEPEHIDALLKLTFEGVR
ncbi:TetR family transcriptional regulator [Mycolicibacterium chitae]|uniref:TetR family transcriptional regulator n=1 Tax=Mycolicibacterium chitae TaxID=1792 RepID=A0A448IEB2_MYCCI|nr:TetR/AcrR family transcriptional regulator [Mycolicibacterium chitae]MCV7107871.1 TetR/AcrR family transcriptional regulator [Mycolicibacterium chitae]BBZ01982.1 TetR family transcriptional regulator [Mycolicibacterium chitae]VEG50806.1 TetR family transcriptional regulator [Mycolicibacterium chitae]